MSTPKIKSSLPQKLEGIDDSSRLDSPQQLSSQSVTSQTFDTRSQTRAQSFVNNLTDLSNSGLKGSLYQTPASSNLLLPQVVFVGEDRFKKSAECSVCKAPFGTVKDRQHHCRLCGESCCHLCSSRTINSQRVCDICFLKATQIKYQKQRSRFIKTMKEHIKKMTGHQVAGEQRIKQLEQEHEIQRHKLEEETQLLKNEHIDLMMNFNYQEEEKRKLLSELKNLTQSLEPKTLQKDKLLAQEQELDQRIRQLDSDIYLKSQTLEEKKKNYDRLKQHLAEIENSDSFINLSLYKEAEKLEPSNISEKIISMKGSKAVQKRNTGKSNDIAFSSFGVEHPRTSSFTTPSHNIAHQLYDAKMLDGDQIEELMNKDKAQKNNQQLAKNVTTEQEFDGGCKAQCGIF